MNENSRVQDPAQQLDKPSHSVDELKAASNEVLLRRLRQMDSPLARQVAAGLWGMLYPALSSFDDETIDDWLLQCRVIDEGRRDRAGKQQDTAHASNLGGVMREAELRWMHAWLENLRRTRLSLILMEDPVSLRDEILADRPILRMLLPKRKLESSADIARFLNEYWQLLHDRKKGIPNSISMAGNFALLTLIMLSSLLANVLPYWLFVAYLVLLTSFCLKYILGLFSMPGPLRARAQLLMLFISFTDEFVEDSSLLPAGKDESCEIEAQDIERNKDGKERRQLEEN
ncbi:hypothetical protein KDL29_13510 [bacterium]|nr:hypothetical protein [bacterium]MCB1221751.1 hypothetical protein [bacterium]UNM08010.1 MAG: hypothetical protein H7A35_14310 [Planctomycetales bacterium]